MTDEKKFSQGDFIVYPAHGVGTVEGIETMKILDQDIELYSIKFAKDKLTLKLPKHKIKSTGVRSLLSHDEFDNAIEVIKGRAKIRRIMWAKRAQEYKTKIESGCQVQIAEVLRDLSRNCSLLSTSEEQSYSERKFYKYALERFSSEFSVIKDITKEDALAKIEDIIASKVIQNTAVLEELEIADGVAA